MKNFLAVLLVAILWCLPPAAQAQLKGNGLPMNQKLLFNLEVIAYDPAHCPSGDPNGHRIAVKANVNDLNSVKGGTASALVRQNDILLAEGPFQVLSGNACVNGTATFMLPANPCSAGLDINCSVDDPSFQTYEVYARLVGKPKTGVNVTTCATDPLTGLVVCSAESWVSVRTNGNTGGPPKFTNVSNDLLSICIDTSVPADGICDVRMALFAPQLQDFFWNWDTTGKAHAQLFFVALPDTAAKK